MMRRAAVRCASVAVCFAWAATLSAAVRSEWLPEKYAAWSQSKRHSLIAREDGVTEFRHVGKTEWTLDAFPRITVRPGEPFTFECRSERVTDGAASQPFFMDTMLFDAKGQLKARSWGRVSVQPGDAGRTTFLVPNGVASLQPRFSGVGNFAGAFPQARFSRAEDVEEITREAGLTPVLALDSPMLAVSFSTSNGVFAVTDHRTGRTWSSSVAAQTASRTIVIQSAIRKTMFAARFVDAETLLRYAIVCRLEPNDPEFSIMLLADADTRLGQQPLAFPPPFASRKGDRVVIPCGEGVGVPADDADRWLWRYAAFSGTGLSMPFFGVAEDASGAGWMAILETPEDAYGICSRTGTDQLWTISPGWIGQNGRFGYTRRMRYVFFDCGGAVAMAARYRAHAHSQGLVRTFAEKARERPAVARLPGAADVWYIPRKNDPGALTMARELKAAGITRFLWRQHGNAAAQTVRDLAAMDGVLVASVDDYRNVYHPEQLKRLGWSSGPNTEAWPADINRSGPHPKDWRRARPVKAKDGTTTHCAWMCDTAAPTYARFRVAADLAARPFTARFISAAAADPWQECLHPAHPITRKESRYWRMELLRLMGDDFRLVVGSEQGQDACVPYCDYLEGTLALPAAFERDGLDPRIRLPLWELVYHDCCAANWHPPAADALPPPPERRRDLLNALYGTAGLFVFDGALWKKHRERFAASYACWAAIARQTSASRMTDFRILSPDRLVQQTVFADGTAVTVDFKSEKVKVERLK